MSMTKIPASPQDELPILSSTQLELDDLCCIPKSDDDDDDDEEVVLMASIKPARTRGRTNPELHFVS